MHVIHIYLQFAKPPQNNARSLLSVASLFGSIYSFKETSTFNRSTRIETIKQLSRERERETEEKKKEKQRQQQQLSKAKLELNTPTSRSWKSLIYLAIKITLLQLIDALKILQFNLGIYLLNPKLYRKVINKKMCHNSSQVEFLTASLLIFVNT